MTLLVVIAPTASLKMRTWRPFGAKWDQWCVAIARKPRSICLCASSVKYVADCLHWSHFLAHAGLWPRSCPFNSCFQPETFDLSKSFITGASEGAAFTQWQSVCRFESTPENYTAFATHSTGLKVKGDGNQLPPCPSDPQYTWGECPTCKYWPTVVGKFDGLKACIFDNTADPNAQNPFFYRTSEQMAQYYKTAGNRYETSYGSGGHCVMHSYEAIATCMDDGTGRLLGSSSPSGNCTDTAPDTNYTCAQQKSFGKCEKPWMNGFW